MPMPKNNPSPFNWPRVTVPFIFRVFEALNINLGVWVKKSVNKSILKESMVNLVSLCVKNKKTSRTKIYDA